MSSANSFSLDQSEIMSSGKGFSGCIEFPLPINNRYILHFSKSKEISDDKLHKAELVEIGLNTVETLRERGENAGDQHFLRLPQ